jgi:hypothetical protein
MAQPSGGPVLAYPATALARPATPVRAAVDALLARHGLRLVAQTGDTGVEVLTLVDGRTGRAPERIPDEVVRQLGAWVDAETASAVA